MTPARTEAAAELAELERRFQEERSVALSPEVARAAENRSRLPYDLVLQLPGRDHVLFTTDLDELSDPTWPYRAGIGWLPSTSPFARRGPMPQLIWPPDRAWCIASEIDFDSTVIAGSRALVKEVLASDLEALEVPEDGDLSRSGDLVNPAPRHR